MDSGKNIIIIEFWCFHPTRQLWVNAHKTSWKWRCTSRWSFPVAGTEKTLMELFLQHLLDTTARRPDCSLSNRRADHLPPNDPLLIWFTLNLSWTTRSPPEWIRPSFPCLQDILTLRLLGLWPQGSPPLMSVLVPQPPGITHISSILFLCSVLHAPLPSPGEGQSTPPNHHYNYLKEFQRTLIFKYNTTMIS